MANDVVSNLGKWLWYLVPANPILVRVVHGGSCRARHLWFRTGYLGILFLVFLFTYLASMNDMSGSLSEVAKTSTQIFRLVAYAQLLMMCFLAPVFTAGAITQERDAETYNILLTTPLSNAQIIFGSLLSRLFFVIVLLFAGLPIFCITMIYGGVTFGQIILSFAIAGATALITGSLAILISMMQVGTRRTIFSFFVAIGLFLLIVGALGYLRIMQVPEALPKPGTTRQMSWLAAFHPFLSLEVGLSEVPAPALADVAHYGWPTKYLLAFPHLSYIILTSLLSFGMICLSMFFVRSGAKEGESTLLNRLTWRLRGSRIEAGERRRKPHKVWSNPIAWREASTKASAASSSIARYGIMVGGVLVSFTILMYLLYEWPVAKAGGGTAPFDATMARTWLMWLVYVEFGLILLVVTNAAATSLTRERESNTMDILMATPLTSKMIVWGKLRGLIAFAAPMLAVPVFNLLIFVVYDAVVWLTAASRGGRVLHFESVVELAALMLVYTALAAIVGLQTSLKSKKTVRAVLVSISVMAIVCSVLSVIGNAFVVSAGPEVGAFAGTFTPFAAVRALVNGASAVSEGGYGFTGTPAVRIMLLIGSSVAVVAYAAVAGGLYRQLVKTFDMTIRKQTAS